MESSKPGSLKIVAIRIEAKKPYYRVDVYETGVRIRSIKRFNDPDFIRRWFLYNQSLFEYNLVSVKESRDGGTIRVIFNENASRHFKLYLFYLMSIANLKSFRKIDCLAKCWSAIDAVSPIVDILWDLSRITDPRRFGGLLRGYCLCK